MQIKERLELGVLIAKARVRDFINGESGEVNIVAMVMLIGIAVMLALAFRDQIESILKTLFGKITTESEGVTNPIDLGQ